MKIAIPLFKERVAPFFGASSQILLVDIQDGIVRQEYKWQVGGQGPLEIARCLLDLGVEKMVCGGINRFQKEWLIGKGISVQDNKRGAVKDIIERLLRD
ncbi:MAG: hypothetical protein JRJ85_22085 [Deltaproteobacteria bacterium]|nr:hypothetical protein [Deltaproteobacteria bacterium]